MKILNDEYSDFHIHSSTFSDGLATIEEIVRFAGEIGLKEIAITDHSDAMMKRPVDENIGRYPNVFNFYPNGARYSLNKRQNVHNDVKVIFGVEGDVLNENGDVCFEIQGLKPDFIILSVHQDKYKSAPETATIGLVHAIERYHDEIACICHPYDKRQLGEYIDIERVVEIANTYHIPVEFNAQTLYYEKAITEKLDYMLENADEVYVNSDAHTLREMKELRKSAFEYLKQKGYMK
jgi:histidinol phosphatase-like PHP family hydrolase